MIDSTLLARVAFACIAVGTVFGIIAGFYLLPEKKSFFKIFYSRPETDFTGMGWKFRQISVFFGYLAIAIAIVSWTLKR